MKKLIIVLALMALAFAAFAASAPTYYTVISIKGAVLAETSSGDPIPLRVGKMLASSAYISVGKDSSVEISAHGKIVTFVDGTIGELGELMESVSPKTGKIPRQSPEKAIQDPGK